MGMLGDDLQDPVPFVDVPKLGSTLARVLSWLHLCPKQSNPDDALVHHCSPTVIGVGSGSASRLAGVQYSTALLCPRDLQTLDSMMMDSQKHFFTGPQVWGNGSGGEGGRGGGPGEGGAEGR